jgi:hypothetical protein
VTGGEGKEGDGR